MSSAKASPAAGITVAGLTASFFAQVYAEQLPVTVPGVSAVEPVAGFLFMSLLAGWIVRDSEARGERKPYDYDTLVAFLWMLAAPIYLVRTRRWKGALILLMALIAAFLIELATEITATAAWEQ